jgi:cytochrome c
MSTSRGFFAAAVALAGAATVSAASAQAPEAPGPDLGRPATAEEIAGWDTTIGPGGSNLPLGGGAAVEGKALYDQHCASCHGKEGRGRTAEELVGGVGSLAGEFPAKTVGSYWPYATTLYDYVYRAMPMAAPRSLTPDELYAVCAYLLFLNEIIGEDEEMNAATLPAVEMPNRDGFVRVYRDP